MTPVFTVNGRVPPQIGAAGVTGAEELRTPSSPCAGQSIWCWLCFLSAADLLLSSHCLNSNKRTQTAREVVKSGSDTWVGTQAAQEMDSEEEQLFTVAVVPVRSRRRRQTQTDPSRRSHQADASASPDPAQSGGGDTFPEISVTYECGQTRTHQRVRQRFSSVCFSSRSSGTLR